LAEFDCFNNKDCEFRQDMYPTFPALRQAKPNQGKPFDGVDVWTCISENYLSPSGEMVYNIEPYRARRAASHAVIPALARAEPCEIRG
jgi:hypothetical protein